MTNDEETSVSLHEILIHCMYSKQHILFNALNMMTEDELAWLSQAVYITLVEPNPEHKLN